MALRVEIIWVIWESFSWAWSLLDVEKKAKEGGF